MQWFKHMSNMRNDPKIKRLISKYGIEGYGLYSLVIESIVDNLTTQSPMPDLQETCEDIADFYRGDTAKINEQMSFMVNQGLFEVDEITGRIMCHKIYKFLEASQTRSAEIRDMIKTYKNNKGLVVASGMSQTVPDNCEEEKRREKKRIEKNTYSECVKLSEEQYKKLIDKFGEHDTKLKIDNLNNYIMSKGKQYKSHYHTILAWSKKDVVKQPTIKPYGKSIFD